VVLRPGQLLYILANMPHLPYNLSATVACTGVLALTDPKEQESVVPYPVPDPGSAMHPNERPRRSSG